MKNFLASACIVLGLVAMQKQTKEYVCLPCGRECDNKIYSEEGTCPSCQMKLVEKSSIRFTNLSIEDFCQRIDANPKLVVLDVRSAAEFNGTSQDMATFGHFKKAINVNVNDLEKRVKELEKYKSKEILVYCSHAHRSAVASYFLSTHGFTKVENMLGGVSKVNSQTPCLSKTFIVHNH